MEKQLIIEEVRNFFDTLYIKYLELNKETETLELFDWKRNSQNKRKEYLLSCSVKKDKNRL